MISLAGNAFFSMFTFTAMSSQPYIEGKKYSFRWRVGEWFYELIYDSDVLPNEGPDSLNRAGGLH